MNIECVLIESITVQWLVPSAAHWVRSLGHMAYLVVQPWPVGASEHCGAVGPLCLLGLGHTQSVEIGLDFTMLSRRGAGGLEPRMLVFLQASALSDGGASRHRRSGSAESSFPN